jgi:hypothetical protein
LCHYYEIHLGMSRTQRFPDALVLPTPCLVLFFCFPHFSSHPFLTPHLISSPSHLLLLSHLIPSCHHVPSSLISVPSPSPSPSPCPTLSVKEQPFRRIRHSCGISWYVLSSIAYHLVLSCILHPSCRVIVPHYVMLSLVSCCLLCGVVLPSLVLCHVARSFMMVTVWPLQV